MIPELGDLEELYQEVILDHSRRPRNFGELPDAAVRVHGDNPACGDEIHLAVKFDGNGGLEDIKFTGHGCAISQASASLMTTKLKGKKRPDVEEMLQAFHDLVTTEKNDAPNSLGDLQVMRGVRKFPQRVKCAMLPWRAVEQALRQSEGEATISTILIDGQMLGAGIIFLVPDRSKVPSRCTAVIEVEDDPMDEDSAVFRYAETGFNTVPSSSNSLFWMFS